jgi:1-deoxy-D-xylulose-5-phosphate synthase
MSSLLESIDSPADIRELSVAEVRQLADEVRELIVEVISRNRGHLASNLGTVELTLALHYCFEFDKDRLVWDCGHQAYAHKIVTGRREDFRTLRQEGGVSGFADSKESAYDCFHFGHTATSISAALGMACADRIAGRDRRIVAVIGDGAMASGMAFEALNHAGGLGCNLLVVLNDNKMSISRSVGAIARYLSKVRSSTHYADLKQELQELLAAIPLVGHSFDGLVARVTEGFQTALTPGGLFLELGFQYFGPVNGHDVGGLIGTLQQLKRLEGPTLLHVLTEKGHGFKPASEDPKKYHSSRRFEFTNGSMYGEEQPTGTSYSKVFGTTLSEIARQNPRVVAITAAMPDGTGLGPFEEEFPERFYDVGICEQHALGLANGLAEGGLKPVFAVYSTFLQRAYDQLFHDVALQHQPAVICIDRAGLVGNDGPTHHGVNDIAYCRAMPGFVVMAPKNGAELAHMLRLALAADLPMAIRYPRESIPDESEEGEVPDFGIGQAEVCREGADGAIIAYGSMVQRAMAAAELLASEDGRQITVVNARFAAPLDLDTIRKVIGESPGVLIAEEHSIAGGFGSAVLEVLAGESIDLGRVRLAAIPLEFIPHAARSDQLAHLSLDGPGLANRLRELLAG